MQFGHEPCQTIDKKPETDRNSAASHHHTNPNSVRKHVLTSTPCCPHLLIMQKISNIFQKFGKQIQQHRKTLIDGQRGQTDGRATHEFSCVRACVRACKQANKQATQTNLPHWGGLALFGTPSFRYIALRWYIRCYTLLYAALRRYTLLYGAIRCHMLLYAVLRFYTVLYTDIRSYILLLGKPLKQQNTCSPNKPGDTTNPRPNNPCNHFIRSPNHKLACILRLHNRSIKT